MKGTTGLDFQLTWLLSSKNLMKVSLTRLAGHSISAPGMAAERGDLQTETPRMRSEDGGANGGLWLRLQREMRTLQNPLFIHSFTHVLCVLNCFNANVVEFQRINIFIFYPLFKYIFSLKNLKNYYY